MAADSLEISTLLAPVPVETKPEPVIEPKPQTEKTVQNNESKVPMRQENVLRMDEQPREVPTTISVTPSTIKARPNSSFVIGKRDFDPVSEGVASTGSGKGPNSNNTSIIANNSKPIEKEDKDETEKPPPIVKPKEEKPPTMVSGGVVNGKARNLVMPPYPAAAKNIGAKGEVKVQVVIDEDGNVISASAVSGHPLLRNSAINAAKASKFTPTTLSNQKVKVTGFIVYNFT